MKRYLVVSDKSYVKRRFEEWKESRSKKTEQWTILRHGDYIETSALDLPEYIFFMHWSKMVPSSLISAFNCVNFHMTPLPFGRGGSPLQNLIAEGFESTFVTAHKMTGEIDAGPIYATLPLSLNGTAEEIYMRATDVSFRLIDIIVTNNTKPIPQSGRPTYFIRRTPDQSKLGKMHTGDKAELVNVYDHIRMLDCEGYPHAFLEDNGFRYEFSRATLRDGRIVADVEITKCQ